MHPATKFSSAAEASACPAPAILAAHSNEPSLNRPVTLLRLWPHIRPLTRHRWPDKLELQRLGRNQAFLFDFYRIEPGLLWLAWLKVVLAEDAGADTPTRSRRPIRALRQAFTGVGKKAWVRLLKRSPAEFPCDPHAVHSHVLREQLVDSQVPAIGPAQEWLSAFEVEPDQDTAVQLAHLAVQRGVARTLAREGLDRISNGDWHRFEATELPLLLAWLNARAGTLSVGERHLDHNRLLQRAAQWKAGRDAREMGEGDAWNSPVGALCFEGYQVRPITDCFELWQEGVHMHHCVGTYANRCRLGDMHVFHVHPLVGGLEWTLALVRSDPLRWRILGLGGVANLISPGEVIAWGGAFAEWYGTVEPVASSTTTTGMIKKTNTCPVCQEKDYCEFDTYIAPWLGFPSNYRQRAQHRGLA